MIMFKNTCSNIFQRASNIAVPTILQLYMRFYGVHANNNVFFFFMYSLYVFIYSIIYSMYVFMYYLCTFDRIKNKQIFHIYIYIMYIIKLHVYYLQHLQTIMYNWIA